MKDIEDNMEPTKDPTDPKNFKPKELEVQMTADQIALAALVSCFDKTVDGLLEQSGHKPIMANVPTNCVVSVIKVFAIAETPEDTYKILKQCRAIDTCDKNKLKHLKAAIRVGMIIARQIFKVV